MSSSRHVVTTTRSRRGMGVDDRDGQFPPGGRIAGKSGPPGGPRPISETGISRGVAAAIRLAHSRRKAMLKFERGPQMWVEPTSVEQATAEPVARHKASRFACPLVVDLCSGIGGDAIALAARSERDRR